MLNLMEQGKKVCFISLEQSKPQLLARLAGIMAGVDDEDIQMGRTPTDKKVDVKEAIDFIRKSGSTIYLESDFEKVKKAMFIELKKNKPDIYYLDYIQNVSNKSGGNTNDRLEEVARYFQEFCVKNDVPMWFASQMNRATHALKDSQEDGSMGHKSSGQIGASSSVTIMKRTEHTPEEVAYRRNNGIPLESTWHIIKNRDGAGVGNIKMFFHPITHKLYNYEQFDKEYGYGRYLSEVDLIPDEIKEARLSESEKLKRRFDEF
jgi:replicative DNA helicase